MTSGDVMDPLPIGDESALAAFAARLAAIARPGDVIALDGDLGAGKTSFARAFIRARLGPGEEVPSPTFTLVQDYDDPAGWTIHHFDLYRLDDPEETLELGLEDAFADGVTLIEWPDRLGGWLPAGALIIGLEIGREEGTRLLRPRGPESWAERLRGVVA